MRSNVQQRHGLTPSVHGAGHSSMEYPIRVTEFDGVRAVHVHEKPTHERPLTTWSWEKQMLQLPQRGGSLVR